MPFCRLAYVSPAVQFVEFVASVSAGDVHWVLRGIDGWILDLRVGGLVCLASCVVFRWGSDDGPAKAGK